MSGSTGLLLVLLMVSSQAHAKAADKICLAYTAKREAENQSIRAQKGVVEVVKRRMQQRKASCLRVVAEKHQFSWWHKNLKMNVEQDWLTKLDNMRTMPSVTPGCSTFFFSDDIRTPSWARKMKVAKREGNMKFLCEVKR
jgi:spore germination cell wall hydrolase CwlJ-like protein